MESKEEEEEKECCRGSEAAEPEDELRARFVTAGTPRGQVSSLWSRRVLFQSNG